MKHISIRLMLPAVLAAILLLAALPVTGSRAPRTKKTAAKTAVRRTDTLPRNDRRRYDYFYLEAVRQQEAGHYDAAFELFNHCLSIDPSAAETYYALAAY